MQVLPFIMRRTKEAVLSDLPPKILQDVYVDPSPLQRRLYEHFGRSPASAEIASAANVKAPHVFQVRDLHPEPPYENPVRASPHFASSAAVRRQKAASPSWFAHSNVTGLVPIFSLFVGNLNRVRCVQALQYLRKLCSHPLLVLDPSVPEHVAAVHAELGGNWAAAQVNVGSQFVVCRTITGCL